MCHRRTDCLERLLSRTLRVVGTVVGVCPWPFLLLPMAISGMLGSGFMMLQIHETNDLESQFTPIRGPAKGERSTVQMHFPTQDNQHFSVPRMTTEGTFAALLAVTKQGSSILTKPALFEVLVLDRAVQELNTTRHSFHQLCARRNGICNSPNPLIYALREYIKELPNFTWPLAFQGHMFLSPFLGGVELGPGGSKHARPVQAAKALRLLYYLQEDQLSHRQDSDRWLEHFLERIPNILTDLKLTHIQCSQNNPEKLETGFFQINIKVAYFTSHSRQKEFEKSPSEAVPLFYIMYSLTIFFSIISCSRVDCVRTKVWVAAFGVFSSGLAVLSSFGLLLFYGVPFTTMVANSPFLILGVGVVDMFIMLSCWQQTKVMDSVDDRMADTYAKAAVSVTITTLTNVLAFYIGTTTSFQSVRSFCIYTGTAFVFCYLYNLTFFGAVLALNGRREESNRHWFTFMKVESEPQESRSCAYNKCCIGGSFDESTGRETEHPMHSFFRKHYSPFLMHTWSKAVVVVLYLLYVGSSIYGCAQVKQGKDLQNLANDHSYVIQYYDWEEKYFKVYGPRVMVVVAESVDYWKPSVRAYLGKCLERLETSLYVEKELTESWLRTYEAIADDLSLNLDDQMFFIGNLSILFNITPESRWDIDFNEIDISASRFFIQTANVTTAVDETKLLNQLRSLAKDCQIPLMVYHPAFIYIDQHIVIVQNTIQNVLIAVVAMLFVSWLLIPNPLYSLWVAFAIASVIVGVAGFMAYWNVTLNSISMLNLVICIGFSVDFAAHVSYAFVSSKKPEVNAKAMDALYRVGYPIVQGTVSTILGVIVLFVASNYIFRTFFKIMFLVIVFGAIHGLIFIPVFLTFFGFCGQFTSRQHQNSVEGYENSADEKVIRVSSVNVKPQEP